MYVHHCLVVVVVTAAAAVQFPLRDFDGRLLRDVSHEEVDEDVLAVGGGLVHRLVHQGAEPLRVEVVVIPMDKRSTCTRKEKKILPNEITDPFIFQLYTRQNHGVFIGPLGGVSPELFLVVPEVRSGGKADDSIREVPPDAERKVDLLRREPGVVVQLEDGLGLG